MVLETLLKITYLTVFTSGSKQKKCLFHDAIYKLAEQTKKMFVPRRHLQVGHQTFFFNNQ